MRLPPWLRPRSATIAELREQLTAAQTAHTAALEAIPAAEATFDDAGAESAARALQTAAEAERYAAAHVARAGRLLAAAEAAEAENARADLIRRRDALQARLTRAAVEAAVAPLATRKVDLLAKVADVDVERSRMAAALATTESELLAVLRDLGDPRQSGVYLDADGIARIHGYDDPAAIALSEQATIALLAARCSGLPQRHPLLAQLAALRDAPPVPAYLDLEEVTS